MRAALDSNIMIYAEGLNDPERRAAAQAHIKSLGPSTLVVPLQAAGELATAWRKLGRRDAAFASARAQDWCQNFTVQETTQNVFETALDIMSRHGFQMWDSIILSAAEASGASVLLSEDMQSGFRWRDVTIVNPFLFSPNELVEFVSMSTRH
jgi:predicted nucleic acid-binding protein